MKIRWRKTLSTALQEGAKPAHPREPNLQDKLIERHPQQGKTKQEA